MDNVFGRNRNVPDDPGMSINGSINIANIQAALRNWTQTNNDQVAPAVVTPPSPRTFACVLTQAVASGIFLVGISFAYSLTRIDSGDPALIAMTTQQSAAQIGITNATQVGSNAPAPLDFQGTYVSSSSAGILITSGGGTPTGPLSQAIISNPGSPAKGAFSWTGLVTNTTSEGTRPNSPFPVGHNVGFFFVMSTVTVNWTLSSLSIWSVELPR